MEAKVFENAIAMAKAHGAAVYRAKMRQAHVTISHYKTGARIYSFPVCIGPCRKCDRIWIDLRSSLSDVKVVEVRLTETTAPA